MVENPYTTSNNRTLVAVSSSDGLSPVNIWADPVTHGLVVSATISSVGLATSANQTNGNQITQIQGSGGGVATVTGGKLDVNATASLAGTALPISAATTAVGVAIVDGSGNQITSFGGGSQYTDGAATIAHPIGTIPVYDNAGTIASVSTTNRLPVVATLSGAVPAGANVIGHVISDTGSTTAVTGTVTISGAVTEATLDAALISQEAATSSIKGLTAFGAVTTNAPTYTTAKSDALSLDTSGLLRVSLKDTPANTNKLLVTPDSVALPANQSVNVSQINAVTPLMGNGTTGTGSQRVTIASDNTAFSVNATLAAETTKVIGVVRNSDGAGNLWTSNSTTYTAKFAQDSNLLGTLGTAFSTAGKVDVKAADGDVFVRQATAANLNATVVGTGTFAVQATVAAAATNIAKAEDVASADADVGVPAMAIRKATPGNTSGTDGDYEMLQMSAGRMWVSATVDTALPAGTALVGKVGLDQTTPGTTNAVSVAQLGANTIATGNGASSTGVQRVAQVNDGTGVLATVSTVTSLTQMNGQAIALNTGTRSAGTQRVTIATDDIVPASQSGTWTVQPGNTPNTSPWLTTQTPKTSGGLTTYHLVSAATTNATNIKASAGQVFGWFVYNSNAAARKLVFHNTAGSPTAGASVFFSIVIPPSAGANVEFTNGIAFSSGIAITTVTGLADNDSAAVALNDLIINVFYS